MNELFRFRGNSDSLGNFLPLLLSNRIVEEIKLNPCRRGALSELKAAVWLLQQGYEVFKNVSPEGPFDLVAVRPGETVYVDVKTCTPRVNYGVRCLQALYENKSGAKYPDLNKKLLYVYGDHVAWKVGEIPFDQFSR